MHTTPTQEFYLPHWTDRRRHTRNDDDVSSISNVNVNMHMNVDMNMNTTMEEGYYYYGSTALPSDSGFGSGFLSSSNPSLNAGSGFYFDDAQQNPRLSNMNDRNIELV